VKKLRLFLLLLLVSGLALFLHATAAALPDAAPKFDQKFFLEMKWRSIGPFRAGRTLAVTGVRGQPEVYYFGSVNGGVWVRGWWVRGWPVLGESRGGISGHYDQRSGRGSRRALHERHL
jgi:hypothetical protein